MLHYAAGLPDAGYIYSMLNNAGANEDAMDLVILFTDYIRLH